MYVHAYVHVLLYGWMIQPIGKHVVRTAMSWIEKIVGKGLEFFVRWIFPEKNFKHN
jgi:hypothetical protein